MGIGRTIPAPPVLAAARSRGQQRCRGGQPGSTAPSGTGARGTSVPRRASRLWGWRAAAGGRTGTARPLQKRRRRKRREPPPRSMASCSGSGPKCSRTLTGGRPGTTASSWGTTRTPSCPRTSTGPKRRGTGRTMQVQPPGRRRTCTCPGHPSPPMPTRAIPSSRVMSTRSCRAVWSGEVRPWPGSS